MCRCLYVIPVPTLRLNMTSSFTKINMCMCLCMVLPVHQYCLDRSHSKHISFLWSTQNYFPYSRSLISMVKNWFANSCPLITYQFKLFWIQHVHVSSYGVACTSSMSRSKLFQANYFSLVYTKSFSKFKVLNHYGEKLIRKFVSINYFSIQVILNSTCACAFLWCCLFIVDLSI